MALTVVDIGQYREATEGLRAYLGIGADDHLDGAISPGQSVSSVTSNAYPALASFLDRSRPHAIVVLGDSTTAMLGGLAAYHAKIHVIHIESGTRTGSLQSPHPEELNRRMLSQVCTLCFAPTSKSASLLMFEGIHPTRVFTVGSTSTDQLLWSTEHPPGDSKDSVLLQAVPDTSGMRAGARALARGEQPSDQRASRATAELTELREQILSDRRHVILVALDDAPSDSEGGQGGLVDALCQAVRRVAAVSDGGGENVSVRAGNGGKNIPLVVFQLPADAEVRRTIWAQLGAISSVWLVEPMEYP